MPQTPPRPLKPLAYALFTLLGVDTLLAVANALATGLQLWLYQALAGGAALDQEDSALLDGSEHLLDTLQYAGMGLRLAVIALWCVWTYRAYRNLERASLQDLRHSAGWAVGWYFVPLANVVKPYQVMMELWRRSHAGWVARRSKLVVAWWGCWLLANALANVAARIFTQAQSDAQLANASAWLLVSYGLDVPMALLAMALVHRVTTLQRTELARAEGSFQNT